MKERKSITRAVLDSVLSLYATIASLSGYVTTAALAAYNYATQTWTQSFVQTTLYDAFVAFNVKDNVQIAVNYVQEIAPSGTGAEEGELCLLAVESPAVYEFSEGSWVKSFDIDPEEKYRILFSESGSDETEPGYLATMAIYTCEDGEIDIYALVANDNFYLDSENKQYRYTGTELVEFPTPATNLLSDEQKTAIDNAGLASTDTVAKLSDIPAPQLTSNEVTAIQNASLANTDTVAKLSDIPSIPAPQLTSNEVTSIQNASLQATDTVAKLSDIPSIPDPQLSANELTAIQNASLQATDTVAKLSDLSTFSEMTNFRNGIYCGDDSEYEDTKAMLHLNGENGSTTIVDEFKHTWTCARNAKLSTSNYKFGSSSVRMTNRNDYVSSVSDDYIIGTRDFTIDFWATRADYGIFVSFNDKNSQIYDQGTGYIFFALNGVDVIYGWASWGGGAWKHVALTRKGGVIRLFINGVQIGSAYNSTYNFVGNALYLGNPQYNVSPGYIDEFRFSPSYARWDAAFTPPSAPYADSANGTEGTIALRKIDEDITTSVTYTNYSKLLSIQTLYSGASAPELESGELRMWKNTVDGLLYQVYSDGSTVYKSPAWSST